jgi:hypothetical protein
MEESIAKRKPRQTVVSYFSSDVGCPLFHSITSICRTPKQLLLEHTPLDAILHDARRSGFPWHQYAHSFLIEVEHETHAYQSLIYYIKNRHIMPNKRWTAFYYTYVSPNIKSVHQLVIICLDLSDATMIKMQMPDADAELPTVIRGNPYR